MIEFAVLKKHDGVKGKSKAAGSSKLPSLLRKLAKMDLDCLVVTHLPNLRYLFGFTGSAASALLTPAGSFLFVDSRYTVQAHEETVRCAVESTAASPDEALAKKIIEQGACIVGLEACHIALSRYQYLKKRLPRKVSLRPTDTLIEDLRTVKTLEEIEEIRNTLKLTTLAFDAIIPAVKPGIRESELAAELEYQLRRFGARKASFDTIVASGFRSAMPHAAASDRRLRKGEFVVFDFGAYREGYASDMTRTVFLGKPSTEDRRIYGAVLSAIKNAEAGLRSGITGRIVDRMARIEIERAGYGEYFVHGTGHGIGLEVHEAPFINARQTGRLRGNMVFTIEPGIYIPGKCGVRIEDVVKAEKTGCKVLTQYTKELMEL